MNKMYLKRVNEFGQISFRETKAKNISVKIIDKIRHDNIDVYAHLIKDAIIVSNKYAGCDACIFFEN